MLVPFETLLVAFSSLVVFFLEKDVNVIQNELRLNSFILYKNR